MSGATQFVEPLESRQFLSVAPFGPQAAYRPVEVHALHVNQAPAKKKPKPAPAPTNYDLSGTWKGNVKFKFLWHTDKRHMTFEVTNVDLANNRITGLINIEDHDDYAGQFAGKIGPKGKFTFTIWDDDKVQISGQINKNNTAIKGTLTIWYNDHNPKFKRDFSIVKV